MPLPNPKNKEKKSEFVARCISELTTDKEFKSQEQRVAVCYSKWEDSKSKADIVANASSDETLFNYSQEECAECNYTESDEDGEELNEDNFYCPEDSEYASDEEFDLDKSEIVDYDVAAELPGLWENIRKKKEREGKNYKPAQPGDKDRPSKEAFEKAQAAEYQGRTVKLNKPFRTPNGPKKFAVYTKNQKGTVVIVRFGDPNMEIKRDSPERRKAFRARHNCDNPGPNWKPKKWSCRMWTGKPVSSITG
jgi:hypothetical protein